MVTKTQCLAHFARDRDSIVTTDASRTGPGKTLWQKQKRQHNPNNRIRQQIFERHREKLIDRRVRYFISSMGATEISFLFVR